MPPKPSTHRVRKHRAKKRENKESYELFQATEAKRQRDLRAEKKASMTPNEREAQKKYERDRKRKQRHKKKQQDSDSNQDTPDQQQRAFLTVQSKGKALSRAKKGLPHDDIKRAAVLQEMVHEHSDSLTPQSKKRFLQNFFHPKRQKLCFGDRQKRSDSISPELVQHIHDFYQRDDISRMLPGKKDSKNVTIDGQTVKKQKRLLLMTTREAFTLYKTEYPENDVGRSKFQQHRPEWVLPTTGKDQDVCMCRYHENIELLLRPLKRVIHDLPLYGDEMVKLTVCNMEDEKCVDRLCPDCGIDKCQDRIAEHEISAEKMNDKLVYYQWQYVEGKITKKEIETDVSSALDDLMSQLEPFARHVYNTYRQHAEMKKLKETLPPGHIIIHEDFSENYTLKHQGEIMAAHWNSDSCTLFTIIVYYRENEELKHLSYTIVSDELSHTKDAVVAFNKMLMDDLKTKLPFKVDHVHYWSDGAGSQFKNRFCFTNML